MSVSKWGYSPSKCDGKPCIGDCDLCSKGDQMEEYRYGMRLRGYSIGCQPKGVIDREDDPTGRYYDILTYDRELSSHEVEAYDLDLIEGSE